MLIFVCAGISITGAGHTYPMTTYLPTGSSSGGSTVGGSNGNKALGGMTASDMLAQGGFTTAVLPQGTSRIRLFELLRLRPWVDPIVFIYIIGNLRVVVFGCIMNNISSDQMCWRLLVALMQCIYRFENTLRGHFLTVLWNTLLTV